MTRRPRPPGLPGRPLDSREVLRVMDAAQVIHERRAAMREHESFDRKAAIREIQTIYEEMGDLVSDRAIARALDEHLAQRHAFVPAPPGARRGLALMYVRRKWIGTRLLLPAAAAAGLLWGGLAAAELRSERMAERAEARLAAFETDLDGIHASITAIAREDLAIDRAADLARLADAQLAARDAAGLEDTERRYRELRDLVAAEFRIVAYGGVWRRHSDIPGVRNHYLLVRAEAPGGGSARVPVRNEETGETRAVSEWGERVPKEVYDRVAADKSDNGIIDDEEFGFKRRGHVTAERRHPDVGQITEW